MIEAVLFDFGGVILSSPFEGFARYEREADLPPGFIRRINSTNADDNAWAHWERGDIDRATFVERFEAEARALGHGIDAARVLAALRGTLRPAMVAAIERLQGTVALAMITNNMDPMDRVGPPRTSTHDLLDRFDLIVESSVVGLRKPDPAIFELTCRRLGTAPHACVFLDDLGVNCKPARALGMTTIKVVDPDDALLELERVLGRDLRTG
jgi:putative hydrolase of the HAD superfamily